MRDGLASTDEPPFHLERFHTPCGHALLITIPDPASTDVIIALGWEDYEAPLRDWLHRHHGEHAARPAPHPGASVARRALDAYWDGEIGAIDVLAVRPAGTAFQLQVWQALRQIPAGTTLSYAALAARLGRPRATRPVGLANGANPISIVIPCHRVIGAAGSLTGYGGGLDRKRWLLGHEARLLAPLGGLSQTNAT